MDDAERLRNDLVFSLFQTNRNPFVDVPEWVAAVFVPQLAIEGLPTGIRLRWEETGLPLTLESAATLTTTWQTVTNALSLDAQGWFIELAATNSHRLYRLRL